MNYDFQLMVLREHGQHGLCFQQLNNMKIISIIYHVGYTSLYKWPRRVSSMIAYCDKYMGSLKKQDIWL